MSISFVIMILSVIIVSYAHGHGDTDPKNLPIAVDLDENFLFSVNMKFEQLLERLGRDFNKNVVLLKSYQNCMSLGKKNESQDHLIFRCFIDMSTLFFMSIKDDDEFLKEVDWKVKQFTMEVDESYVDSKDFNKSYVDCISSSPENKKSTIRLLSCIVTGIETFFTNVNESPNELGIAPNDPSRAVENENFLNFVRIMFEKFFHYLDIEFSNKNKTLIIYENCPLALVRGLETEDHKLLRCFIETSALFVQPKKYDDTFLNEVNWKIKQFTMGVDVDYNNDKNFNESYKKCISSPREVKEKVISTVQEEKEKSISSPQEENERGIFSAQEENEKGISSLQKEEKSDAPIVSTEMEIESDAHQLFRCIATAIDTFLQ